MDRAKTHLSRWRQKEGQTTPIRELYHCPLWQHRRCPEKWWARKSLPENLQSGFCRSFTHLDEAGVGHHLFGVDHVHQRLLNGHVTDAGHIEAVHVFPPWWTKHIDSALSPLYFNFNELWEFKQMVRSCFSVFWAEKSRLCTSKEVNWKINK